MTTVGVVLLNWNSYELVADCLRSLLRATYPDLRCYVVDNGSADPSEPDRIRVQFPDVVTIALSENVGFARACNVGIKQAMEEGAGHIILLNSDTVVEPDFAEALLESAERDETVGAVTGKIYYFADRRRIWCAGGKHHWLQGTCEYVGEGTLDCGQFDGPREVTFATMCFSLFPRCVFESVGLLPEQYFFGLEEWHYSVRLRRAGYKLLYVPRSVVYHKVGQSYGRFEAGMIYNYYRNKLMFTRSYMPRWFWPLWYAAFASYALGVAPWRMKLFARDKGEARRRGDRTYDGVSPGTVRRVIRRAFRDARTKDRVAWEDIQSVREELGLPLVGIR